MTRTIFVFLLAAIRAGAAAAPPDPETSVVFHAGEDGYFIYRIPAALMSPKGSVLAFAEGRKDSAEDESNIDVLLKRSVDGGKTWSRAQLLADQGAATIGNPCPLVDRKTKTIFLLLTGNPANITRRQLIESVAGTRTVWITKSRDDGVTWSPPVEITPSVKDPGWSWYATGPGIGIQLANGRLVVPCNHRLKGQTTPYSHVIYSDDHGATWKIGGTVGENTNECQVVELADGSLMINARSYAGKSRRAVAVSHDQGLTWSPVQLDETLIEPICQASILRLTKQPGSRNRLLFSNPADPKERKNLTVRLSYDEGSTWPLSKALEPGPAGYSSLVVLPGHKIGCFYERIAARDYSLVFARFTLEWLTGRGDRLR